MQVTLRVEGHLREFFPHLRTAAPLVLAAPATVEQILQQAGIPPELPGSVLVGGLRVERSFVPADGDELMVLSPLAGG